MVSADREFTTPPVPEPPGDDPPVNDPPIGKPPLSDPPIVDPPKPPVIDLAPEIGDAGVTLARAGKHRTRRRASFSFTVSEPAAVTAVVTRAAPGVRVRGRCVAASKHRPHGVRSCTRQLSATKGTVALHAAGPGALQLSAAGLGKSSYTATLTAVDEAGNASAPVVVLFTVGVAAPQPPLRSRRPVVARRAKVGPCRAA